MKITPVILSGGSGTRLWPLSTAEQPKQFLALTADETMFQLTIARASDPARFDPPIIVANGRHADLVEQQLADMGVEPGAVILEPAAKNTAPAIAIAALEAGADDTLMLVMPSDHAIADSDEFRTAVAQAAPVARDGWLVTFGIRPSGPETGYGYIEMNDVPMGDSGLATVLRFIEKPDEERARSMLRQGGFVWNAGIFLMRADRYLAALEQYEPDVVSAARQAHDRQTKVGARRLPDADSFAAAPSISIDYAVMERSDTVAAMPLDCGWSDIGSWDALADQHLPDPSGSVVRGNALVHDSTNCMVRSDDVRVHLHGVSDLIVVASGGEVVIMPRGTSQNMRAVVDAARERDAETSAS
ncbi:mannose-1-phosphate guanylyltransferase/mannose-6-phosphate isomerase [Novosphingopyxis iocasae]|uniref:mannose-1-phosphate guanylyltransferase/mannose-6-phosphate isomerase n=1 Tax=Novosphingopyxis iocasae TaxID=2762729 RepID=UPI0016511CE1|nr:mannose-1-phosphate guanylyltransferase/mannose-6-phosphate isomerase [Novosphingopyxis iocasae]